MQRSRIHHARRLVAIATIALAAWLALSPAAFAACPQTSLPAIEDEVMCPVCGVPLVNAGGPQAEQERTFIRDRVDRCESKEQIRSALIAEYGEEVLAVPGDDGFDLAAYLVPVAALLGGLVAITAGALRWRRTHDDAPATAQDAPAAGSDRLDRDLERYDL